jgi:hypothetical protein
LVRPASKTFVSVGPFIRASLFSAEHKVQKRAEAWQKDNHEYPNDPLVANQAWILDGIDEHPEPEHKS